MRASQTQCPGRDQFQPFICWSVAFEWSIRFPFFLQSLSFNPLFVGVWLLNGHACHIAYVPVRFQPFICWSVAFELKLRATIIRLD